MKIPSAWSFRMNAASRLVVRELEHGVGHPSHGPTRGAEDARCRLGVGAVNTTSKFGWTMIVAVAGVATAVYWKPFARPGKGCAMRPV
jgi:hypothetical protein